MINLYNVVTENGKYKSVRTATENGALFYAVEFWRDGHFVDDIATFRVYPDGSAEGFSSDSIYVVSSEEKIFSELVQAVDESLKGGM